MIRYEWGMPYDEFAVRAAPLIQAHWDEVGSHRDILTLNPNHDRYRGAEKMGIMHLLTAWDGPRMAGYLIAFITAHSRDREATLGALNDVIYTVPEYRSRLVGYRMLQNALDLMDERKVNIAIFAEKVGRTSPRLMKRLGFEPWEIVYSRILRPKG